MITTGSKYTNHLINENSPYLLQHAHNPVNWFPWGEEAFIKARSENKLVLVSIGYAACHWCHVMEHESFEDEDVASIMNNNFVCIKVDREERPDIDQIYMDAVQLLTRSGGWPLNCFVLPDGRPIFGGTYFPKENWKQVLQSLNEVYTRDYEKVIEQANAITAGLSDISPLLQGEQTSTFTSQYIDQYYNTLSRSFDSIQGGNKGAPKFPMPVIYEYLLKHYFHTQNTEVLESSLLTLDKMAQGGIFDHLGGGFARYSTDEQWLVPHFEKMLYDNSQLISLYCKAYKITQNKAYREIITNTISFVDRELTSPEGAFYSSLDADSEGEEGKFYVWTKREIDEILGNSSDEFCRVYQITEKGNWENGKNIIHILKFPGEKEAYFLKECREKLFEVREKRIRPGLDSKILCSWNALMIEAYLEAYTALGDEIYFRKALSNAVYLEQNHINKGRVLRVNQNQKTIQGFLDDYAFTAKAFIRLFQITCNEKWLQYARDLAVEALVSFYDPNTGMFFYTSAHDAPLAVRKHEIHDNVTPASNSVMAQVLLQLGKYYNIPEYSDIAKTMVKSLSGTILNYAGYHSGWAKTACDLAFPLFEVAVTGPEAVNKVLELESHYLPHILICGSPVESFLPLLEHRYRPGETWIYVCENQTCKLPVNKTEVVLQQLSGQLQT